MNLERSAASLLAQNLALKEEESCLVVCDISRESLGRTVYRAAKEVTASSRLHVLPKPSPVGWQAKVMRQLEKAMVGQDAILLLTGRSLSHTEARKRAVESGARVISMPGVTEELMIRSTTASYLEISKRSQKLKNIFLEGEKISVRTHLGTDVTFIISGMEVHCEDGLYHQPGRWGNLPAGEVSVLPKEGSACGIIWVDWSMSGVGPLPEPIIMKVERGLAVDISGKQADRILGRLNPFGQTAFTIAEFGMGTNGQADLSGIILEDEKVLGTVHFALGNNISFGGSVAVPVHLDGVLKDPTVIVDGRPIMNQGHPCFE